MLLSAHQPSYLPYIGFFNKSIQSDVFIFADHVQYVKKGWQNRNRIKIVNDGWRWLTVPIQDSVAKRKIAEVEIDDETNWEEKHWKALVSNYGKAPFFKCYRGFFEELYAKRWVRLADLNEAVTLHLFEELGIELETVRGSALNLQGNKTDMIIDMCRKVGADTYLSGVGGREYLEEEKFKENSIILLYQDFHHPTYPQVTEPFIPNMSAIDLLFNLGNEKSRKIILDSGNTTPAKSKID